jgi:hypothetical protein
MRYDQGLYLSPLSGYCVAEAIDLLILDVLNHC